MLLLAWVSLTAMEGLGCSGRIGTKLICSSTLLIGLPLAFVDIKFSDCSVYEQLARLSEKSGLTEI